MDQNFFAAFISYSSPDLVFASRLQQWLEGFEVPQHVHKNGPDALTRLRPVFLDTSELPASEDLSQALRKELEVSRVVIAVCSRHAAASEWVDWELKHFRLVKPDGLILAILSPGTVYHKDDVASFLPKLLLTEWLAGRKLAVAYTDREGENAAFMRIAARLLGVRYSVLADRHAERERQIRRHRSRLAAKAHTLPAETAFLSGDVELSLKHGLAAIIEGDDPTWGEAPELESTIAEYVMRYQDRLKFRIVAPSGNSVIVDQALVAAGYLLIAGMRDGRILMTDAQTGELRREFTGEMLWKYFETSYPNSRAHRPHWFQQTWDPIHPIGRVVESNSRGHLILTHGAAATSWRVSDCVPTGLFLGGVGYNLFAFSSWQPLAALAWDEENTTTRITLVNCKTGDFIGSQMQSWEPLSMAFSSGPWGEQLIILSRAGLLSTLDLKSLEVIARIPVHGDRVSDAVLLQGGRALRINGRTFTRIGEPTLMPSYWVREDDGQWRPGIDPILGQTGLGSDYRIAAHSADGTRAVVYNLEGSPLLLVPNSNHPPVKLEIAGLDPAFSPDGTRLLMREPREVVHLIDAATGQLIRSIRNDGVGRDIPERTWSQDSRFFALSSSKIRTTTSLEELMLDLGGSSQQPRSIEVRDGQTGHVVSTIVSLGEQVDLAGFTPQSDAVWVVKRRCDIRLVRIGEPRLLWTSEANQRIDELAIGPDGTLVAAVLGIYLDERKAIRTMHAESGKTSNEIQLDSGACRLYFRTGTELIVSCADGTVRLYDADKATETKRFRDHVRKSNREEVPLTLMAVSPDGGVVVTATGEDAIAPVVARDLRHNTRKPLAKSKSTEARCIAVSLDGEKFAYSDSGGESFVILRRTGRVIVRGDRPVTVRAVAISIDEQRNRLIVLGAFGELQIFDLQNGQMEAPHTITLLNPEYGLDTGIILPESNLVIAAEERLVQIVDLDSRKATYLQGRDVYAMPPLATSPDGGLLAAASPDGAVGLWRTGDGRRVSILRRHRAGVSALRFSRDGGRLISADVEGLVCAWDVTDASLRGAALTEWIQTRTGRGLLVLDESDDDNLLLRDLLNDAGSTSRDLIEALGRFRQVSNSTSNLR